MSEKKRILIVDDDESFVESNKDLLEAHGYEVLTAHDGQKGLALAKLKRPDLMILDVMMTRPTEGFEVSREIRETPELRGMRVLLVTGVRKEMNASFGLQPDETWLPVDKVLEKPVPPERLIEEVQSELGS